MSIRIGAVREFGFNVADRIVAEVTNQAAMKLGQAIGLGDLEGMQVVLDKAQRIVSFFVTDDFTVNLE